MDKNSTQYSPAPVPSDPKEIGLYLEDELSKIQSSINSALSLNVPMIYAEPGRISDGDVVYADGTTWNPGSGKGLYYYKSGTGWVFIA